MAKAIVDMWEAAGGITISIQARKGWIVRLGVWIIRLGCKIGGFGFVEEFPMSLIQKDFGVYIQKEAIKKQDEMRRKYLGIDDLDPGFPRRLRFNGPSHS